MSLLDDILNHKIETKDTPKKDTLKQILNNEIPQTSQPMGQYQASIFASRVSPVDSLSTQRKFAAEKLQASRQNYQDYLNEQTKEARSQKVSPLSSQTTYDLSARRTEMEQLASQNAQALEKAIKSQKGQELKADVKQKQNTFNYANYLANQAEVENTDYNILQKLANPIVSGVADLFQVDRIDPESQYYYDSQGNKTYLPTKRSLKQQKIRQESGGALGVYNDVVYNLSKAVSSKIIDSFVPGAGQMLYYSDIMLDSTEEAKKQGYTNAESLAYGAGVTVMARFLDDVIGTFGGLSNANSKVPTLSQGLDKFFSKIVKSPIASTILSNMGSEAISEFAEEYADNALKYIINSDQSGYDSFVNMLGETWGDALYSGLVGGISGGIGGTIENITNDTEIQERKQALEDYKTTLENIKPQTIGEANYKNDELNKVDNAIEQLEQREEEIKQSTKVEEYKKELTKVQEQKEEVAPKEEIKSEDESKETKKSYPNAQNIQQEEGYTAYYDVPAEDYIDIHGRKSAYDIDATTLNNGGFDLITYNDNGTRNIYEFDSKKDLNKYIKAIGGYSALEGQYTIMSNSKEGEFYYVRDKYAKGGWQWEDSSGRILKGTESRTTKLERERQKQLQTIDTVSKQSQLAPKTTTNIKRDVDSIIDETEKTPNQNIDEGNITITNKGISTNINEKMQEDVLKITTPNENPQTISIGEYQVKKPSAKNAAKDLSEQVGTMIDNLSTKEKQEIKNETRKKNTAFKKAQEYAKNTNNKDLTETLNNLEQQAYYNQLDIQENLLTNLLKVYQDLDNAAEKFDADYLNVMAGTPDGSVMEVSSDLVARGQALATYYLDNNMNTKASDVLLKLGKLGTASGQASAQFNAMYQYTPYGIYTQTVNMMDEAYNKIAARKGFNSKWAKENNPNTNPNSRFKLTKEQADYILKESTELFDLHGKDFKEYSIRKGKLQNYIGDIIPHGGAEGFTNWVRTSLLLGTRTIFKNSGSNILDTAYHAANKINYTIYDKAINKKFGTSIRTAGISLDGQKAGFEAGVKTSIQTLNDIIHGTSTSEFGNRYMDSNLSRENITKDFFGTMPTRYQSKIKKLNAVGNWLSQLSTNTLTWGDAKFAASAYEDNRLTLRKLNALQQYKVDNSKNIIYDIKVDDAGTSHVDYINTDGQYDTAVTNDIEKFTEENNMTPLKGGDRLDKLALEYSQSRTYTGDTTFSKTTNTILKAIDTAASKVPGIKQLGIKPTNFIVPFSKIGSNLCYKMYRGSILSIPSIKTAYDNFKAEVDSGQVSIKTQHELVSRLGDLTTGTILYITMGSLAKAAFDNVEADEDDDEASKVSKFMKSIFGKEKYTFKVGDYNFSFDVGGNLSNMLKMSLDLQEVSEKEDATLRDYIEVGLKDILSEWTVSNLTELFNEQYNSNALDNILQTIARVPSMAIPNVVKDVAMTVDNFTQRSVWDEDLGTYAINSIKAKIPFARSTLDAKTDSWGNVMKNGDNLITQFWNTFIVGDQIKKDNSDPVSQELMNLYLITNKVSVIPNSSKTYFSYNSTRYDLDDKEEQQYLQTYAKSAHDNLDKLFSSDLYQNADTESRLKYIEEIYEYANDEAKREYLNKKDITYYNYGRQTIITGANDEYKQSQILDAIDNNISYDSAKQYQKNESKFNYYKSFGSYEVYDSITKNVSDIQTTYSSANGYSTAQRRQMVVEYVNSLNNLTAVQKAILIKEKYPASYKSYNEKIKEYLKKQNLDDDTYNAMLKSLKIN